MDDLISRKAMREAMYHEAMEKDSNEQKWDGGCWIRYKMFERVIESLPSVLETGKWIPCSERLPDKDFTDYLVQIGHGKYAIYETAYRLRGRWVFYSDRIDGEGQSIVAWMPLPEPYKEK